MTTAVQVDGVSLGGYGRLGGRAVSSVTALALHVIVLIAVTGAIRVEVTRDIPPVGVQLIGSSDPLVATVIESAVPDSEMPLQLPATQSIDLPVLPPPQLDPIAADSFEAGQEADWASADEFARLQGLYLGQVQGRIHRALQTFAASLAMPSRCTARVIQDERGRVLDVDLTECALDDEPRALLRAAIQRASPLPRPPHGLAMGSYLTLDLTNLPK